MPGPIGVKGKEFDVYMQPLLEELKSVWDPGTTAYDHSMPIGHRRFTLRVGIITTIGDYPRLGMIFGCAHQGATRCILCESNVTSRRSNELGKTIYEGSRRWIRRNHPYRHNFARAHCNNKSENKERPEPQTTTKLLDAASAYTMWIQGKGNRAGSKQDPSKEHGVKRRSCLYDLPYFEVCSIQNNPIACLITANKTFPTSDYFLRRGHPNWMSNCM